MNDLISRQALCEYALNQKDKSVTPNDIMRFPPAQPEDICSECDAWNVYKNYAQPERDEAHWVFVRRVSPVYNHQGVKLWGNEYKCSRCGYRDMAIEDFKSCAFCPNCGKKMAW